ncbi:hypothetical protein BJ170DRAFT_330790 [Xylariales sp. AK1849]|nr:hypothetical protein BJ170DRAFT_330790 [Xylariales sp. AK1849]
MVNQDRYSRDYYSRGLSSWDNVPPPAEDNQYQAPQRARPPRPLDQVLREEAYIPGHTYFLAAIDDNGGVTTFCATPSGPSLLQGKVSKFFSKEAFVKCAHPATNPAPTSTYDEQDFPFEAGVMQYPHGVGSRWGQNRRHGQDLDTFGDEESHKPSKKRPRTMIRRDTDFDEDNPTTVSSKKSIAINDKEGLENFYEQRFKQCQQTACKLIAKAWIKAVEPKKQSTHPYTGADEKAPDWWPQRWGDGNDERVRHKEPDHLYKRERVYLLNHILGMIVEPNEKQHKDIRKLNLTVGKLEEITTEALSSFFADNANPGNRQKKPYLKEIFKVALQEERFRGGGIDETTKIFVSSDERFAEGYASDSEGLSPIKVDDDQGHQPASRSISPPKGAGPHTLMYANAHGSIDNAGSHMQGPGYVSDIPIRGTQFPQPLMGSELAPEQANYVDGNGIPVQASLHPQGTLPMPDLYAGESSRRSSYINPHSGYNSPTTPTVYQQWPASSAATNSSMYTIPEQQSASHPTFGQTRAPMTQSQHYLHPSHDGLPGIFETGHVNMFRPGSVAQSPVAHGPGYSNFVPHEPRGIAGSGVKLEILTRNMN